MVSGSYLTANIGYKIASSLTLLTGITLIQAIRTRRNHTEELKQLIAPVGPSFAGSIITRITSGVVLRCISGYQVSLNQYIMNQHEKYGHNPFRIGNKDYAYFYIDAANRVVYNDYVDSLINFPNKQLRRYVVRSEYVGLFIRYYQLRLHPETLKHVVK